jgi:hypothetical protein
MSTEFEQLQFENAIVVTQNKELRDQVDQLRYLLRQLRGAVALYIHNSKITKDYLVEVLDMTEEP